MPLKLPRVLFEGRLALDLHANDVGDDGAVGSRRPGARETDERLDLRLNQVSAEPDERPAFAERKCFEMRIGEPPLGKLLQRPVGGLPDAGAASQPRPVDVAQPADMVHDLGPRQAFVADLRDHREVQLFGRGLRAREGDRREQQ